MEMIITVTNLVMAVILGGIFGLWVYFLGFMIRSFRLAPRLETFDRTSVSTPKVSVILPARNEERYIGRCLDTLLAQDYSNFQIIAINDSSTDATGKIMQEYSAKDSRVVYVSAPAKPDGWAGKNWACYQGYLRSEGEILMFTDADTEHASNTMSLATQHLLSQNLDALTAVPHLVCNDFWTKITLPALATFLHTRFSPLRVNDPKVKTGYFFGSFFIITRRTYEAVGTHKGVKEELVEDGALGGKVKSSNFKMKMVRGERHIDAIWARDLSSLWHGLRRLMMPLYHQDRIGAGLMTIAVFFILLVPFLTVPYSALASGLAGNISSEILILIQVMAVGIIFITTGFQCAKGVYENPSYALAAPISGAIVSFGFLSAIIDAARRGAVSWRDREYTVSKNQHPIY
ncbi:MAG TPA: glycosyltransferase [Nitrososphaera sp.]|nr:glycosyltransferase [Nitrososphaera sp.]